MTRKPRRSAQEPFETETMADLHAQQGRPGEALIILKKLCETHPEHPDRGRWVARVAELESHIESTAQAGPEVPELPVPEPPGVAAAIGQDEAGNSVAAVAWALPATSHPPVVELFWVQRGADGVHTHHQRLPAEASRGRCFVPAPQAQAVAAAVGFETADGQFVPVARSRQT